MKRTPTQIEVVTENAKTFLPWIDDAGVNRCDGYPDFSGLVGQTKLVLEEEWLRFLGSEEGLIVEPDPEPTSETVPDWIGFNAALLADPHWLAIAPQFSNADIRTGIVSTAGNGNAEGLQSAYLIALADLQNQGVAVDPAAITAWNGYATQFNIPVSFDIPTP